MATAPTIQDTLTRAANDTIVDGKIKYLSTADAYDLWSEVYDTDGNFLQALDTIEMKTSLPRAAALLEQQKPARDIKAVDLGCGTGRNTLQLLDIDSISEVVGLELSPKMMDIARRACQDKLAESGDTKSLSFETFDMIEASSTSTPVPEIAQDADLLISTLVLEHIPLEIFFATASQMLKSGGLLLLTNMHARMGAISQAGFVDPETGNKIRPVSYAHELADVVQAAEKVGLVLEGEIKEVSVDEALAEKLGVRGKKWVGVMVWFGGLWRKI